MYTYQQLVDYIQLRNLIIVCYALYIIAKIQSIGNAKLMRDYRYNATSMLILTSMDYHVMAQETS